MAHSKDRLRKLEDIEREVVKVLHSAGQTALELSKEQPSEDIVNSRATQFLKSLESVEKGLSEQINYLTQVSTGQPHEGSTYGAEMDFQLACERTRHTREQLEHINKTLQNPPNSQPS